MLTILTNCIFMTLKNVPETNEYVFPSLFNEGLTEGLFQVCIYDYLYTGSVDQMCGTRIHLEGIYFFTRPMELAGFYCDHPSVSHSKLDRTGQ